MPTLATILLASLALILAACLAVGLVWASGFIVGVIA